MKTTMVLTVLASLGLAACDAQEPSGDDLDSVDVGGLDGKADSLFYPTEMGELQLLFAQTHELTPRTSGYQVYTFEGKLGWQVSFVQKSGAFRTYLRIYAPSGRRVSRSGVRNADNGAYYSTLNVALPETGTYTVLATSYDNMRNYPHAHTSGEYTLSSDARLTCAGIAGLQCPSYLKCLGVAAYPDAAGTCALPTACLAVSDCDGLIHPYCAIGPNGGWKCDAEARGAAGSCRYACGGY